MALAQSCVRNAPARHKSERNVAIAAVRTQLNVFAREADVALQVAAALGNPTEQLMGFALSFSQPRKQPPLVHDSTQVEMQAISTT